MSHGKTPALLRETDAEGAGDAPATCSALEEARSQAVHYSDQSWTALGTAAQGDRKGDEMRVEALIEPSAVLCCLA